MKDLTSDMRSLVVDLGTATTKSGWSEQGEPDFVFPSLVGRGRHKGAMLNLGLRDSYVGHQAQTLQGILTLRAPFRQGCVQHWDDLELLWDYVWNREMAKSNLDNASPSDYQVLVSVPPLCSPQDWRRMAEMLLEGLGIGGIYLANKSVLSMYGSGRTTGVCVDSGEDMTYVVPCWEGSPLPDATLILKLGGKHITDRLLMQLSNGKYSFPDDTFLLWKRSGKRRNGTFNNRFCVASRRDIVREAKERFCKFSYRPMNNNNNNVINSSNNSALMGIEEQVLRLPDGNMVIVGEESVTAPELMFKPELAKKPTGGSPIVGLHELVFEAVMRCDEKFRPRLLSNIVLTGGNTMIPNMDIRLQKELAQMLLPSSETLNRVATVRVHAQKGRDSFTWSGGAHLTSLSSFQRLWLTKQDYMETGATLNIQEGTVYE